MIEQMDLTDIYGTFYPAVAEETLKAHMKHCPGWIKYCDPKVKIIIVIGMPKEL